MRTAALQASGLTVLRASFFLAACLDGGESLEPDDGAGGAGASSGGSGASSAGGSVAGHLQTGEWSNNRLVSPIWPGGSRGALPPRRTT
jgi:hypothetical protein